MRIQVTRTPTEYYELTRLRKKPIQVPSEETVRRYMAHLETLTALLPRERVSWQLEGGMAVAAHLGGFRRRHRDIDIGLFARNILDLEACLAEHGFRLFARNPFHPMEYTPFDVVRAATGEEILSGKRVKRLTAAKVDGTGRVVVDDSTLTRFDVHVHHRVNGLVYLTSERNPFPIDLFENNGRTYDLGTRRSFRAASAPFLYYFKLRSRRPRHAFDLRMLNENGLITQQEKNRATELYTEHYASGRAPKSNGNEAKPMREQNRAAIGRALEEPPGIVNS